MLRLGWEFNATWYPWAVTDASQAAHYARVLPRRGADHAGGAGDALPLRVEPRAGAHGVQPARTPTPATPMSTTWGSTSTTRCGASPWRAPGVAPYVTEANGLAWLASFAAAHHKPAALPEWGAAYPLRRPRAG